MTYHVSRAAVELRRDDDPTAARQTWLGRWRKLAIGVSFAHMMTTIALYSSGEWYAGIVAGAMTLLIDVAIYELIEYLLGAHRDGFAPHPAIPLFLALAIVLSVGLNAAYLWGERPPAERVPTWLSVVVVGALAVFVPGWVAVAAVMSAELEGRRAVGQAAAQEAAQEAAQLRTALDDARAAVARLEGEAARRLPDLARQADEAARLRATIETQAREVAQARASAAQEAAQLRADLEAARAAAALDPRTVARELREAGVATRTIARALGRPESTVRGWQ